MAIDPTKAKRDIDFNTYVAPKEGSRVDWTKQAKTITDTVTGIATDRQKRKDDIDIDTKSNIDKLNELDQMDNKTLMDMTIDGSNNAANAIYDAEQKMKRGELRPQDFQKLKNNISSGFTQFQKNAKSWDTDFKRYSDRMDEGKSSSLEQYLGERMESFGNLKNLQLVTNPDTGNLAFGRIDENGVLLTGPDDLISMNRMTAISKQEIDKVNVGEAVTGAVDELGTYIMAGNASEMGKDGSSRAVVSIEDFMQTKEANTYITNKAREVLRSKGMFSTGSVLSDNGVQNKLGENFKGGDQKDFDKWLTDNPNADASQNPIIVMGEKENGVIIEPAITEGQQQAAQEYMERSIRGAIDHKEKMTESTFKPNKETNYEMATNRAKEKASNLYTVVEDLVAGSGTKSSSAGTQLANSINQQNTKSANYNPIQQILRLDDTFVIKRKGEEDVVIDAIVDGKDLTGDEIGGEIWDKVTSGDYSWEEAKGDRTIGDRGTEKSESARTATTKIEQPNYSLGIVIDGKETNIKTEVDKIPDLGGAFKGDTWLTKGAQESVKEGAKKYQNIMSEVFNNSSTPGIKEAFAGEEISVKPAGTDGYNMTFTIGDMVFNYPQDVEGYDANGGKTATSKMYDQPSDIWPQIELFIDRAIKSKKSGSKSKKKLP